MSYLNSVVVTHLTARVQYWPTSSNNMAATLTTCIKEQCADIQMLWSEDVVGAGIHQELLRQCFAVAKCVEWTKCFKMAKQVSFTDVEMLRVSLHIEGCRKLWTGPCDNYQEQKAVDSSADEQVLIEGGAHLTWRPAENVLFCRHTEV
jgi:hypothetical protein